MWKGLVFVFRHFILLVVKTHNPLFLAYFSWRYLRNKIKQSSLNLLVQQSGSHATGDGRLHTLCFRYGWISILPETWKNMGAKKHSTWMPGSNILCRVDTLWTMTFKTISTLLRNVYSQRINSWLDPWIQYHNCSWILCLHHHHNHP